MMKLDQDQRGSIPFHTSARGIPPPLVTTNFTVIDDGEQRVIQQLSTILLSGNFLVAKIVILQKYA